MVMIIKDAKKHRLLGDLTLSKKLIATAVQEATDLSATKSNDVAGAVLDQVVRILLTEGRFVVPGVGTLSVKETKARDARNPKTGETIKVPAGKTVRFKVSGTLKGDLN